MMISSQLRFRAVLQLLIAGLALSACSSDPRNQLPSVPPATAQSPMTVQPPALEGYHDITNCNGIIGWAWDSSRPDEPVKVELYDGATLLTTVTAGDFRPDLLNAKKGNGKHGFTYTIPPSLKDGKPHAIRMKFAGTNTELTSTPRTITCTLAPPA